MPQLRPKLALYRILADRIRDEIVRGHWSHGEQIPTEGELVEEYGVSRATVRQALSLLEHEGYVVTRHGAGRFISRPDAIVAAGIEQLASMTRTIADQGRKPGMRFLDRSWRAASPQEADSLQVTNGSRVLAIKRAITADRKVVAFSHDVLPEHILPPDFILRELKGSIFEFLETRCQIVPKAASANIHAVRSDDTDWDADQPDALYVLLDQIHFSDTGAPILYSRTYFIQDRFNFTVVRTR